MAVSVIEDIIEGGGIVKDKNGITRIRKFHVSGLTPGTGTLWQAMNSVGVPAFGSVDPDISGLVALRVEPRPFKNSQDQAIVTVQYMQGDTFETIITFDAVSREVRNNYDANHDKIIVKYSPSGDITSDQTHPLVGQIISTKAYGILTVERSEFSDPAPRLAFINKLNSGSFFGQPKWTWLVRNIRIRRALYAATGWRVVYVLEYDAETHVKTVAWRNLDGFIPVGIATPVDTTTLGMQNGYTTCLAQQDADYSALGLPSGF